MSDHFFKGDNANSPKQHIKTKNKQGFNSHAHPKGPASFTQSFFNPYQPVSLPKHASDEKSLKKNIDSLIATVFLNSEGLKLLAYLEQITILKPSFNVGWKVEYSFFREGQNDIVRQLIEALSRYSSPQTLRAKLSAALSKHFSYPKKIT